MLEILSLLVVAAPWPVALWLAYSIFRGTGPVHGLTFGTVLFALLTAVYAAGYRSTDQWTQQRDLNAATFALAFMTLQAYGLLVVGMVVKEWLSAKRRVKE